MIYLHITMCVAALALVTELLKTILGIKMEKAGNGYYTLAFVAQVCNQIC